ncbi:hypothetical protein C2S51_037317 [Perilla frutescens var. frutescens]|nr:hypothetical protein C2S51_037317 [Perilla frutescens var. frutescens]
MAGQSVEEIDVDEGFPQTPTSSAIPSVDLNSPPPKPKPKAKRGKSQITSTMDVIVGVINYYEIAPEVDEGFPQTPMPSAIFPVHLNSPPPKLKPKAKKEKRVQENFVLDFYFSLD